MTHKVLTYAALFFLVICINTLRAQEAVAPNGKFANIKGLKLYYEDSGKGTPLIVLHGFNGTGSFWKTFTQQYEKQYRVITVDLPGHGRSDFMDTTRVYLHKRAAEYILGLVDQLKLDSVFVMGHSSGGFISTYMASLRPDVVRRIIVIDGQVYYSRKTRDIITNCCGNPPGQPAIARHGKEKATLLQRQFYHFRLLHGDPSFTPDVLASIKSKAFIIHGDDDQIAPLFNAMEMYNNIPRAHLWVVPRGGHAPFGDPAIHPEFIRLTLAFLSGAWDQQR